MTLVIVGGLIMAFAALIGTVAVLAGVAWIFIFGDDPWPEWSNAAIMTIALIVAAIAGISTVRSIWRSTRPGKAA